MLSMDMTTTINMSMNFSITTYFQFRYGIENIKTNFPHYTHLCLIVW